MKGKLFIISGFTGAGKGTIIKEIIKKTENVKLSISATTRKMRIGEIDGVNYFFVSKENFLKMIENDDLIEYAEYVDNFYGTPKKFVEETLNNGKNVILEIEVQGALKVKEKFNDAISIFIIPPSVDILYNRLKLRGTESDEQIKNRFKQALNELEIVEKYDYLVVNDDLTKAVDNIISIINNQKYENISIKEIKDNFKKDFRRHINV